ncbi:MAG TPA: tetratricopeptide repeat protein, partial [Bryobacteraceae bacterium]
MASKLRLLLALSAAMLLAAKESPETLLEQARADLDAGRFAHAIENAEACAIDFRAASDNRHLAAALRVIGLARLYSGSYDLAVPSLTEALALSRQLHDFGSEIARLNDLGMASYDQGRYRDALDRYEEAQARVRQVPNDKWSPWARQITTANIAILYQTLGQYDRALSLYSGLLTSSDALEPAEHAQLLSNVGALRRRLGDPVKALETYRKAQALYRR